MASSCVENYHDKDLKVSIITEQKSDRFWRNALEQFNTDEVLGFAYSIRFDDEKTVGDQEVSKQVAKLEQEAFAAWEKHKFLHGFKIISIDIIKSKKKYEDVIQEIFDSQKELDKQFDKTESVVFILSASVEDKTSHDQKLIECAMRCSSFNRYSVSGLFFMSQSEKIRGVWVDAMNKFKQAVIDLDLLRGCFNIQYSMLEAEHEKHSSDALKLALQRSQRFIPPKGSDLQTAKTKLDAGLGFISEYRCLSVVAENLKRQVRITSWKYEFLCHTKEGGEFLDTFKKTYKTHRSAIDSHFNIPSTKNINIEVAYTKILENCITDKNFRKIDDMIKKMQFQELTSRQGITNTDPSGVDDEDTDVQLSPKPGPEHSETLIERQITGSQFAAASTPSQSTIFDRSDPATPEYVQGKKSTIFDRSEPATPEYVQGKQSPRSDQRSMSATRVYVPPNQEEQSHIPQSLSEAAEAAQSVSRAISRASRPDERNCDRKASVVREAAAEEGAAEERAADEVCSAARALTTLAAKAAEEAGEEETADEEAAEERAADEEVCSAARALTTLAAKAAEEAGEEEAAVVDVRLDYEAVDVLDDFDWFAGVPFGEE